MRFLSCIALCALAQAAMGQRIDSARVDSAKKPVRLAPVIVTGSLSALPTATLGMSRSLLGAAALRLEPMRALVEPLRNVPGVFIDEANGPMGPTIIRIRGGEETFTQILVDGVQINENGGFFDAQGLTLSGLDRIEIARGPLSAIYGSSAMSGVVQLFTRQGAPGPLRAEGLLEGGRTSVHGGSARATVDLSGGSDRLRYAAGGGRTTDRGPYRIAHDLEANDLSGRIDLLPSRALRLTGIARYMDVDSRLPVRDAGVTRAPLDSNQRQGRERALASIEGAWTPSDRWSHLLAVSGFQRGFTYDDGKDGLVAADYPFFVFDFNYHYKATVRRGTARYVGSVRAARPDAESVAALALSYGGQLERETLDDTASGDFGPARSSLGRNSVAGFVEAQGRLLERLSLVVGARIEKFGGLDREFVPRATTVLTVVPDRLALRAAAGRAYKAPNIQDQFPNNPVIIANPELQPERSSTWELGTDVSAARGRGSVAYFNQDISNMIRSVPSDVPDKQINRNLGRSSVSGIEVEVEATPRERWATGAHASWLTTRVDDNNGLPAAQFPNGEELPYRPAHTASAFVRIPARRSLTIVLRATNIGRQTVLTERFSGSRVVIDPYTVGMATATWSFRRPIEAYIHAENVLDAKCETAYDKPGSPRSIGVGLRAKY